MTGQNSAAMTGATASPAEDKRPREVPVRLEGESSSPRLIDSRSMSRPDVTVLSAPNFAAGRDLRSVRLACAQEMGDICGRRGHDTSERPSLGRCFRRCDRRRQSADTDQQDDSLCQHNVGTRQRVFRPYCSSVPGRLESRIHLQTQRQPSPSLRNMWTRRHPQEIPKGGVCRCARHRQRLAAFQRYS